jgi:hypothetical protein
VAASAGGGVSDMATPNPLAGGVSSFHFRSAAGLEHPGPNTGKQQLDPALELPDQTVGQVWNLPHVGKF